MGEEHDSWFKTAFGVDLGEAAGKIKEEASEAFDQAKAQVTQVVQAVEGKVEGALDGVVKGAAGAVSSAAAAAKKAAGAVLPSGSSSAGSGGGGTGSFPLGGSVGRGGKNAANDVRAVQGALGISADGQCGPQTIAAIEAFQRNLGQARPDGRVDAGGATERALTGGAGSTPPSSTSSSAPSDDDSALGQIRKGASGLLGSVTDLGGRVVKGGEELLGKVVPATAEPGEDGGGLLSGLAGTLANPGALLGDIKGAASPLEIEVSLGEHDIPVGGKIKVTVGLTATGSTKVSGLPGVGLLVGKDGAALKVATKVWDSDAVLRVGGVDLFAKPKFELKGKADKKGVTIKVSFSSVTSIGKLGFSFTLFELKLENVKSPTFGAVGGSFEGIPTKYPDQSIAGIQFTEVQIAFSGELKVALDLVKILAQKAAEKALEEGATIAAEGAAAGGAGGAGAAAVAVAPLAGIAGGIVGGLALTAGVCAAIGALQDLGKDAMAVCTQGRRDLNAYAKSYGSAMRGKPGADARGNQDAEVRLQMLMRVGSMSRAEAIEAAVESDQEYEELAYRAVLPIMREEIRKKYKEKEGFFGSLFSGNVLEQVLNDVLASDSHFSG